MKHAPFETCAVNVVLPFPSGSSKTDYSVYPLKVKFGSAQIYSISRELKLILTRFNVKNVSCIVVAGIYIYILSLQI